MAGWITYTSAQEKLHFSYPPDWKASTPTIPAGDGGDTLTLKSPNGTQLLWNSYVTGVGGYCPPGGAPNVVVVSTTTSAGVPGASIVETTQGTFGRHLSVYGGKGAPAPMPTPGDTGQCNNHFEVLLSRSDPNRLMWLSAGGNGSLAPADVAVVRHILESAGY
jgi:hypothetical protein